MKPRGDQRHVSPLGGETIDIGAAGPRPGHGPRTGRFPVSASLCAAEHSPAAWLNQMACLAPSYVGVSDKRTYELRKRCGGAAKRSQKNPEMSHA
jgi:hypothetical protein